VHFHTDVTQTKNTDVTQNFSINHIIAQKTKPDGGGQLPKADSAKLNFIRYEHSGTNRHIHRLPAGAQTQRQTLHDLTLRVSPDCKLWFTDGKNSEGKVVSNPNIGYGFYTIKYADGTQKEFYRVGLSANTTGISVYILGLEDKTYLAQTFGKDIGKASVTGYCIKFKALKDINLEVLEAAIRYGLELPS